MTMGRAAEYYTYTAESMLIFFWYVAETIAYLNRRVQLTNSSNRAVELAYSIFQMQKFKMHHKKGGLIAKATALILPAILMGVLRTKAAQQNVIVYMFLSNAVSMWTSTFPWLGIKCSLANQCTLQRSGREHDRFIPASRDIDQVHPRQKGIGIMEGSLWPAIQGHGDQP